MNGIEIIDLGKKIKLELVKIQNTPKISTHIETGQLLHIVPPKADTIKKTVISLGETHSAN
ncbi:MAG: hypothetical protein LBI79_03835 [Nitrososphaerota archaeon]|nr:hypothetical protein [Nitrososphaerota archaeon]